MTNGETNLKNAIEAMQSGKLTSYEVEFVKKIENYSKKEIAKLSSKQYDLLRKCAGKK